MTVEIIKTTLIKDSDIQSNRKETFISKDHRENNLIEKCTAVEK